MNDSNASAAPSVRERKAKAPSLKRIVADQDLHYAGMIPFSSITRQVCDQFGLVVEDVLNNVSMGDPQALSDARTLIALRLRTERACLMPQIATYLNCDDEDEILRSLWRAFGNIPSPMLDVPTLLAEPAAKRGPGRPRKTHWTPPSLAEEGLA